MVSQAALALVAGSVVLLVSAALVPLMARHRQLAGWLNAASSLTAGVLLGGVGVAVLLNGTASFELPLGVIDLHFLVDGFSALFLVLISLMAVVVAVYTIGYMEHYPQYGLGGFYRHYPLFILGMAGIVIVDDLSWGFTVAWQLMTLASFFLIRFDHDDGFIVRSATKYLVLMGFAWLFVVGGAVALSGSFAGESAAELATVVAAASVPHQIAVFALVLVGFALKAGVFPLGQLWLPDAHSSAPSPISALLSGVMIKTGVYGIVRTLFWMMPASELAQGGRYLGMLVATFGVVTLFIGTVQALKQHDAKRLHAYHSIGQMGYILLGVGTAHFLCLSDTPALQTLALLALIGAVYHTLNHAVFKSLLFLCTGSVQLATGSKDINKAGGLIRLMPVTALVAAIAAASIAGVPAFSGFVSKWAVISSNLLAGRDAQVFVYFGIIALMTSAITLASYVKFFGMTFTSAGSQWHAPHVVHEVGATMLVPKVLLAGLCVVQGLVPWLFVGVIGSAFGAAKGSIVQRLFVDPGLGSRLSASGAGLSLSLEGGVAAGAVIMPVVLVAALVLAVAFAGLVRRAGGAEARSVAPWMCGYQELSDATRYPSSNMYAAFKGFMKWTGGDKHGV